MGFFLGLKLIKYACPRLNYDGVCSVTLELSMDIDEDKIDEAALALMHLTLHDEFRAWKQIDWEVTNRLYEKGLICDPVGKAKSVIMTEEGIKKSKELFVKLFSK